MKAAARARSFPAGFTLVELLVSMAIGAVVLAQVSIVTFSLQRSFAAADYRMNAQNDQLRALDYLSRDLHMASAVSVQESGTAVTLVLPSTTASALDLNLGSLLNPLLANSGIPSNAATVSYYLTGNQLIRDTNGVQTVVANTVAELTLGPPSRSIDVSIRFTPPSSGSSAAAAPAQDTRASSRVYLRNVVTTN